MPSEIVLSNQDPTVFAKCFPCTSHGKGKSVMTYYGKAYTPTDWAKVPVCDNCGSRMTFLYEVS